MMEEQDQVRYAKKKNYILPRHRRYPFLFSLYVKVTIGASFCNLQPVHTCLLYDFAYVAALISEKIS